MFNSGRRYGTVNRIDYLKDVFFPDGKHSTGRYCKLTELPYYEVRRGNEWGYLVSPTRFRALSRGVSSW
jgi:hypothetical protein